MIHTHQQFKKRPDTISTVATSFKTYKLLSEIQTHSPEEGSTAKNLKVMCISPTTRGVEQKQVQCTSNSLKPLQNPPKQLTMQHPRALP